MGLECRKHLETQKLGGAAVGNIHLHSLPAAFPAKLIKEKKKEKHRAFKFHTDVDWEALRCGWSLSELCQLCGAERLKIRGMYFITGMNKL